MFIGSHRIDPPVALAPMAGVSDKPFRQLCRRFGAGLAVSEMTIADRRLWGTPKSRRRMDFDGERAPVSVQIAGYDPAMLADAARHNVDLGAQIIDINMGCPAKKVCAVASGSALLRDEALVGCILDAVVRAVTVPVTLKMRTGYSRAGRNALRIARLAESAGIAALAIHGRTREDLFAGMAEHETAAAVKAAIGIPVFVNGDIASGEDARRVLEQTGADGVMIGRAAHGQPWLFREIAAALAGQTYVPPDAREIAATVREHLEAIYAHYGATMGVRIARKHLAWYGRGLAGEREFRAAVNRAEHPEVQMRLVAALVEGAPAGAIALPA
jgi:tRNA-dihydrouridine synthase B